VTGFPVASAKEVRGYARRLMLRYPGRLALTVAIQAASAAFGLAGPWLLGNLVQDIQDHGAVDITRTVLLIGGCVVLQASLGFVGDYAAAKLGERVLAELREEFVSNTLRLPLGEVERAGTGDLVTRTVLDVSQLSSVVRNAVPDTLITMTTLVIAVVALLLVSPLVAFPGLIAVPFLWASTRWYLKRSRAAFLRKNASYSQITQGLAETVLGARTVEALRIGAQRYERADSDIAECYEAERWSLRLRTVYLPIVDTAYMMPTAATLLIGGLFYIHHMIGLAAVTTATLYMQQIVSPIDLLLARMDNLQVGSASLARLLGVRRPAQPATEDGAALGSAAGSGAAGGGAAGNGADRDGAAGQGSGSASRRVPAAGRDLAVCGASYAYRPGHDVLHEIQLTVEHGERLAIVGPSGAGKSTLGRLLAGIETPRAGSVTVGGVPLTALPIQDLRRQIVLVTQEYHIFGGSLRDNVVLACPDADDTRIERALRAVDAWDWVSAAGLGARVGAGGEELPPAQAQQLSLARLLVADPHTLVLDEATSMLDPRAARHLERSLAAVTQGRTVIAIAHRLQTARDADRVAVMDSGRIIELGPHDELVRRDGVYASLWKSWHGSAVSAGAGPGAGEAQPAPFC
jgi:ABC-type multidrug transport system fused ATPase/permease subunit